mmetsp:Transcript_48604/g.72544  ORF Transcript_48604/g.72544 Transcript_48604/m.72544 type:complete len:83 (-) Transcript_48604:930-1178(-)
MDQSHNLLACVIQYKIFPLLNLLKREHQPGRGTAQAINRKEEAAANTTYISLLQHSFLTCLFAICGLKARRCEIPSSSSSSL